MGAGGPACPRNAILVGAWWLMREMELATVRAPHVAFSGAWDRSGCGVRLTLPASKNDQAAFGTSRAHRCRCQEEMAVDCPVHAVLSQWFWLRSEFPERFAGGAPELDLPLFPTLRGEVVTKPAFVSTIIFAGRYLGVVDSPDGTERLTGHSLRPTGGPGPHRNGVAHGRCQADGAVAIRDGPPLYTRSRTPRPIRPGSFNRPFVRRAAGRCPAAGAYSTGTGRPRTGGVGHEPGFGRVPSGALR